jgi:hypothetical protein
MAALPMENTLVPESILAGLENEVTRLILAGGLTLNIDPNDEFYGSALRRTLMFDNASILRSVPGLTEQTIVYNRYYWHSIFERLYFIKAGFDAKVAGRTIQVLGEARCPIDWAVIEDLDELVEAEVERLMESKSLF